MKKPIKILGIAGSLRKGSYNKAALRAAVELVPKDATLAIAEIGDLPLYNADLEKNFPAPAKKFKEKVRQADAILFVTPEYNYSVPGVLKNAIDWASRPFGDSAWEGKPAAIMGAATGPMGTVRAQLHLRDMFVYLNILPLNHPQVLIGDAKKKFDEQGNLTDEITKERIKEMLAALVVWTKRLQK